MHRNDNNGPVGELFIVKQVKKEPQVELVGAI